MPKRTSINDVKEMEQLNDLDQIVKDKRNEKRADAKKERRNRHYVKVLIKHQLIHSTDELPHEDWNQPYVIGVRKKYFGWIVSFGNVKPACFTGILFVNTNHVQLL